MSSTLTASEVTEARRLCAESQEGGRQVLAGQIAMPEVSHV